ncbi:alpha-1,2-fucosyltransferase [Flavobacteriaceae bacterium]|nr:alpha-1,2-fucosyltransferase [Flavobacteriaceae bacterium]
MKSESQIMTYLNLGSERRGNLGNQLFQIASTIGLAKTHDYDVYFNDWPFFKYFDFDFKILNKKRQFKTIAEQHYHYYNWTIEGAYVAIDGWLQSEKYFENSDIKSVFKFKDKYLKEAREYFEMRACERPGLLISIRRGDFVNNPNYYQLEYYDYFFVLLKEFPNWRKYTLFISSDDIQYCKDKLGFLKNVVFIDEISPIKILALSTLMQHCIISNSTFSWWLAFLLEKEGSIILRPEKNFSIEYCLQNNDKDYYPSRWRVFSSKRNFFELIKLFNRNNFWALAYFGAKLWFRAKWQFIWKKINGVTKLSAIFR